MGRNASDSIPSDGFGPEDFENDMEVLLHQRMGDFSSWYGKRFAAFLEKLKKEVLINHGHLTPERNIFDYLAEQEGKCGVNPILGTPGINTKKSGKLGELRVGIGGQGGFLDRGGHHKGIDIRAPVGTPVLASHYGRVVLSGMVNGYGNTVIIKHSPNAYTLYAHLQQPSRFHVGDGVETRDAIGYAGRTGNPPQSQLASEDHLHFGFKASPMVLRKGASFDDPVARINNPCP